MVSCASIMDENEGFLADDNFYSVMKSGIGEKVWMKFKVSKEILDDPSRVKTFVFSKKTKEYTLEDYLIRAVNNAEKINASVFGKTIFEPLAKGEGNIYLGSEGELRVRFPIYVSKRDGKSYSTHAMYIEEMGDGKIIQKFHFD